MTNKISVMQLPNLCLYTVDDNKVQFNYKFAKEKYNGQDEIVAYLKSGVVYGAKPEIMHDNFTHEKIPYESLVMTDGHYRWSSELLYYVEKYNMMLPKEFVSIINKDRKVRVTQSDLV